MRDQQTTCEGALGRWNVCLEIDIGGYRGLVSLFKMLHVFFGFLPVAPGILIYLMAFRYWSAVGVWLPTSGPDSEEFLLHQSLVDISFSAAVLGILPMLFFLLIARLLHYKTRNLWALALLAVWAVSFGMLFFDPVFDWYLD